MTEPEARTEQPTFVPSPEFLVRRKRVEDAVNLRKPDRVPVVPLVVHYYPTKIKAISNRDAMYLPEITTQAWKEAAIRHDWDAAVPWGSLLNARAWEALGITQVSWPGQKLRADQPFQWVENEYMTLNEYDELFSDPNGFAVRKLWPRISSVLAPLGGMAQMPPPPLAFLSNAYTLPVLLGEIISSSPLKDILKKALELAEAHEKEKAINIGYTLEMMHAGFPLHFAAVMFPAFDWISDSLRGMRGSMLDMYKAPDKLKTLIDMYTPITIGGAIDWATRARNTGVFIPMHRGAAGFMSDKQFAEFYWPCFKALILGLIDAGLTPIPLFEGDYTPRLEYLRELPPKKVMAHFDRINRVKAKEIIGDTMCFWGNVPASLLCFGTPQQVKDDVRELIDIFGDNGGLIVDGGLGIPDEAKPENVQALTEAVHEYGIY